MKRLPHRIHSLQRWLMPTLCLILLALGTGCVSWDPIFRGSVNLWQLLSALP